MDKVFQIAEDLQEIGPRFKLLAALGERAFAEDLEVVIDTVNEVDRS